MLGRFPRGKGTLLDLEFLEDGGFVFTVCNKYLTRVQKTGGEWLLSVTYVVPIDQADPATDCYDSMQASPVQPWH